jgi:AcrR family transcriptional regulator
LPGRREEKNAETRSKLIAAARQAFGSKGYSAASMDDFTAEAGLTRGALYYHFGDKQGLLKAVVEQIDAEMAARLLEISGSAPSLWDGVVWEWTAYIGMALEPEIQQIMFRDGPAILGDISQWTITDGCVMALKKSFDDLQERGELIHGDTESLARLVNGAASHAATWIAGAENPQETSRKAVESFATLLNALRRE